jgi:hypothetical protein
VNNTQEMKVNAATAKKTTTRVKTLEKELGLGRQAVTYTELIEFAGRKLRVRIKSDSYKFQSFAVLEHLNTMSGNMQWEQIASIPHSNMVTREALYVHDDYRTQERRARMEGQSAFMADRDALVQKAKLLIA